MKESPMIKRGFMKNGMEFVVCKNNYLKGKISTMLRVDVGSFDEEVGELGLAHFVEHIAFDNCKIAQIHYMLNN